MSKVHKSEGGGDIRSRALSKKGEKKLTSQIWGALTNWGGGGWCGNKQTGGGGYKEQGLYQ